MSHYYYPELSSASKWLKKIAQSSSKKHYPDLGSYTSSVWNSCARRVPQASFYRETSYGIAKNRFFSQAECHVIPAPLLEQFHMLAKFNPKLGTYL